MVYEGDSKSLELLSPPGPFYIQSLPQSLTGINFCLCMQFLRLVECRSRNMSFILGSAVLYSDTQIWQSCLGYRSREIAPHYHRFVQNYLVECVHGETSGLIRRQALVTLEQVTYEIVKSWSIYISIFPINSHDSKPLGHKKM